VDAFRRGFFIRHFPTRDEVASLRSEIEPARVQAAAEAKAEEDQLAAIRGQKAQYEREWAELQAISDYIASQLRTNGSGNMRPVAGITDLEITAVINYLTAAGRAGGAGRGRGPVENYPPGPVVQSGGAPVPTVATRAGRWSVTDIDADDVPTPGEREHVSGALMLSFGEIHPGRENAAVEAFREMARYFGALLTEGRISLRVMTEVSELSSDNSLQLAQASPRSVALIGAQ